MVERFVRNEEARGSNPLTSTTLIFRRLRMNSRHAGTHIGTCAAISVDGREYNLERWEEASIIGKGALRRYPDFGALYLPTAMALRITGGRRKRKR